MGGLVHTQTRPSLEPLETGMALRAVQAIGKRLTGKSNYHYQFHVVVDPRINAYALPGGHIVVYTGLLNAANWKAKRIWQAWKRCAEQRLRRMAWKPSSPK